MAVGWFCSALLGVVFLAAGGLKLRSHERFRDTLATTELLPAAAIGAASWLVPLAEVAVGAALLAPIGPRVAGLAGAAGLLAAFLGFLLIYRLRGHRELSCGCFADFEKKTSVSLLLLRNAVLLAAWLVAWSNRGLPPPSLSALEAAFAGLGFLGLAVLWISTRHVAETFRLWRAYAEEGGE